MDTNTISIDSVQLPNTSYCVDLLRLDKIHPTISGNKYFKLKYNLADAVSKGYKKILTIGGNYSNHLHATAFACWEQQLELVALVTNTKLDTPTLNDCILWGTKIISIKKQLLHDALALQAYLKTQFNEYYYIPMGGDNDYGVKGVEEITRLFNASNYETILCAVGTGTTLKGIANKINPKKIIGVAAVNDYSLQNDSSCSISFDYSFGGFAKYNNELIQFYKEFYSLNRIEIDIVYTAKVLWAARDLILQKKINSSTLCIHTGGIQGNRGFRL